MNTISPSSPKIWGLTSVNRRHLHSKWWRFFKKHAGKGQNTSFTRSKHGAYFPFPPACGFLALPLLGHGTCHLGT